LTINDLDMHILECRPDQPEPSPNHPLVILLHGFPELSYSWRKIIQPIADAGYHVVAPDQRGYGRTTFSSGRTQFSDELSPFWMLNLVKDIVHLVYSLGYTSVAAVVGHDFGSPVAGYCALIRPDLFKSVVMMSAPFTGPPAQSIPAYVKFMSQLVNDLAGLDPPRKHYAHYFSTDDANADMCNAPGGLRKFLRTYYHAKSADSTHITTPHRLPILTATALAALPHYYIMPLHASMPQTISAEAPSDAVVANDQWLPNADLDVYVSEYTRTGFQGGLNWYRCLMDSQSLGQLQVFTGMKVVVPAMFIAGKEDWGVYQLPGAAELMRHKVCERMDQEDFIIIEGAGHWVQQEAPDAVLENLLRFLKKHPAQ
jgi:pimeloyl-ACP methyl ester carboxylesterase